ncbi:uncharacterized protein LOC132760141 [Ruditapes philippinarum]|uniref:uncharacterized protein LOC132760141 n=1 Tax=Ruditapes philippinarum TaxID=129788 RepID=UPI00295BA169|nr:uncharacterized protein LOC132760141 [Ruditapes philippinarum]
MESEELDSDLFTNWVRGSKGLEYLQEGLQEFVGEKILQCRDNTLQNIKRTLPSTSPQQCNQCTPRNLYPEHNNTTNACSRNTCRQRNPANCFGSKPRGRRKCPYGICSKLYDAIIDEHVFEDPLWKNTDPSTWCSDPQGWSYAKCFQTTKGPGTSAKDTDAAGLLSIIINNRSIQNFVTSINPTSSFHLARDFRNEIMHSSRLEIDETTLCTYLDAFINVLQDPKYLINDEASKNAVHKLTQLKNNTIHISQGDKVTLLQMRHKALTELDDKTAESLRNLDEKAFAVQQDVNAVKDAALADVKSAGASVKESFIVEKKVAIFDITTAKKQGVQDIAGKITDGISEITTAGEQAKHDIAGKTSEGLSEINTAGEQAKQDIAGKTSEGLSEINTAGEQAKQDIAKKTSDGLSEINTAGEQAKQDFAWKTSEGLSEINTAGEQAIQDIYEAKNDIDEQKREAISDIHNVKEDVLSEINKTGSEAKANVLTGASPVLPDMSVQVVSKESIFQKGIRKLGKVFRPSSSKSHFKKLPSRTTKVSELKDDLIKWYNKNQSTVSLSPLTDEFPTPLAGFYIMPEIDILTYLPGGRKETTRVKSLEDLFTLGRKVPQEIYLSAAAGLGKTAFSKYLALTWCQAHQKDENYKHFKEEELKSLSGFEFLFLVLLRDSTKVCDVDDMIEQQVIQYLPCSSSMPKGILEKILRDEKCLVILDGLDEWTHPDNNKCTKLPKSIPHRCARDKCVILTTSRPWKLGMTKFNHIVETVELVKLNKDNAWQFKCNAMKMLNVKLQDGELNNEVYTFEEAISNHGLEDMESTPLLLLYLICLWTEKKIPIGNGAVELYTRIIQLLISRTKTLNGKFHSSCEKSQSYIPDCFRKHHHFCSYCKFLLTIGKLAFYTLFSKKKESNLVFDKHDAEKYLNQEDLKSSCLSGILSESKVKALINESFKISFSHKTVQEYFSAICISFEKINEVQKIIFEECKILQNILEMSKVFVFISGMNPKLMSAISSDLMPVINNDKITSKYRTMTDYEYMYIKPLKDIQDMYISCSKEGKENKDHKLCLQDFIINEKCQQENYFKQLQYLCQQNKEDIKSIMIQNMGICGLQEVINLFTLSDHPHIEKLFYQGEIVEEEIISLLLNPLKCLTVVSCKWENHQFLEEYCQLSADRINGGLVKLQHLECLCISYFTMTHEVMETLLNFLTSKKSMKEIIVYGLNCSDHDTSCRGFNLDLSQHSQLRRLGLNCIPVSQLNMDVSLLEEGGVGKLYKPGVVSSYLSQLPAASKLQTFRCSDLKSSSDIETMLQTLPLLYHVKYVQLFSMNLGERSLTLTPQMINIERVDLEDITIVLHHIKQFHCKLILITFWPLRPRFPDLLNLSEAHPLCLPLVTNVLQQPKSQICHSNPGVLKLTAWLLSTDSLEKKVFSKLLTTSLRTGTQKDYSTITTFRGASHLQALTLRGSISVKADGETFSTKQDRPGHSSAKIFVPAFKTIQEEHLLSILRELNPSDVKIKQVYF